MFTYSLLHHCDPKPADEVRHVLTPSCLVDIGGVLVYIYKQPYLFKLKNMRLFLETAENYHYINILLLLYIYFKFKNKSAWHYPISGFFKYIII